MVLLNRKMDYALLVLCYLHSKGVGGSAREIATFFKISRPFIANILKDLCQKGFVVSQRGVKGGYILRETTAEKTLAELLDTLDDPVRLAECNVPSPEQCCSLQTQCPIRGPIEEVHHRIRQVFESVKLVEIFQKASAKNSITLGVDRCEPVVAAE